MFTRILFLVVLVAVLPSCSLFESACSKSMPVLTSANALAADAQTSLSRARPALEALPEPERSKALGALNTAESALHVAEQSIALATSACSSPDIGSLFQAFVQTWTAVRPFLALLGGEGTAQVPDPIVYVQARGQ